MGWDRKKPEELLVVHPPRAMDRVVREPLPNLSRLPADPVRVAAAVREIAEADRRALALQAVQARFGNAFTARVIALLHADPPRDVPEDGEEPR